jgi:uncharacterized membrane protein YeiH
MGFTLLGIGWLGLGTDSLQSSLDLAGTVVFAFMGAFWGLHGRTCLGLNRVLLAVICGFLTACGGGTLRTVFMGQTSVFWWSNPQYLGAVGLGTLAVMWMGSQRTLLYIQSWEMADHIALGVFVPIGVEHGLRYTTGASILTVLICSIGIGVLTGVGGGLMRDVILRRIPVAIKTPYGAVATLGAALHMYLDTGIRMNGAWVLSGLIIVLLANFWPSWQVRIRHGRRVLVDGGVNAETAKDCVAAVLAAGTAVFDARD